MNIFFTEWAIQEHYTRRVKRTLHLAQSGTDVPKMKRSFIAKLHVYGKTGFD